MDPTVVAAWIAAGISALTLVGTLAAQYLGYRATSRDAEKTAEEQHKQLDRTLAEQRDQLDRTLAEQNQQLDRTLAEQRTRTLNERFTTAAEQLGSDKPAVRLAGVYAMAGLADDWEENRQTCVDVLCAYLRMPYEPDPGDEAPAKERFAFSASREVRHTVTRVITAHLREDAATSWQGLNFDFTGVVFDGGHFSYAVFSGGWVSFHSACFTGDVSFTGARFTGGRVQFYGARFTGDVSFFSTDFTGGGVNFSGTSFTAGRVTFDFARFTDNQVSFDDASFTGGRVSFDTVKFSGGTVTFRGARFAGSNVSFDSAVFSTGEVTFSGAGFSGGEVDLSHARFSGGEVDFSGAVDWSVPPAFPWTDTPPPGVKLPKKKDQPKA